MRYKWDKKYLYWGITAFAVIVAAEVFRGLLSGYIPVGSFISKLSGALSPLVYGFAIAYLLNPVESFFEKSVYMKLAHRRLVKNNPDHSYGNEGMLKSKKKARAFGVAMAMLTLFVAITGIIIIIIPQLIVAIQKLAGNMPGYAEDISKWINEQLANYPDIQDWLNSALDNAWVTLSQWLNDTIVPKMSEIITTFTGGLMAAVQVIMNLFFGIIIAIYFLYNKELFAAQLKKILYSVTSPRYGNAVIKNMREVHRTFGSFLSGKIIDSLIIMGIFFVVLTAFNFPYAVLCSVVVGIFNIIPMFGPIIGAVPCALLILLEDPLYCLYFIIVTIIIQQLDGNVIGPLVLGESTGLSGFWIIFALLLGQSIFGFMGLIIGIPLFAVIYSIIRAKVGNRLESKGLPSDSNVYRKVAYLDEDSGGLITLYEMNRDAQIKKEQELLQKQTKHGSLRRKLGKLFRKNK